MITHKYIRAGMDVSAFPLFSYYYIHKDMFRNTCVKDYSIYRCIHTHTIMHEFINLNIQMNQLIKYSYTSYSASNSSPHTSGSPGASLGQKRDLNIQ